LTMDGGRYFFLRGMVFAGFHCLPGRRLKWRSKGVQLALKGVQVIYTSASTFKKSSASRIDVISKPVVKINRSTA